MTAVRDDGHVAVSVADEGRGVAAERLPHLFRKFSRTDGGNRGRGPGGSGLGLAICRGIVEAHGGRIWAESDGEGMGARLTFTIPVVVEAGIGAQPDPPGSPPPSRRSQREQKRVLAVDDDPRALRYVRDALSRAGYTPIVTADPEEVPRLLEEERPHLVLLDLMLPGTDGIELMKDIFDLADVPVIFLSVYGQEDVIARAFDAGATDYVVKPFSPTELAARIRAALDRRGATGRPRTREPYVLGDLTIDYAERRVSVAGRPVRLTAIEHQLLVELSLHAGLVLTHDHLLRRVWGPGKLRRPAAAAHGRQEPPPQAGRRRRQPRVHLHRAPRRLPHGEGRGAGRAGGVSAGHDAATADSSAAFASGNSSTREGRPRR